MSESTPRFFSPEWFRAEAIHYADFEAETKEQLAWFQSQYGLDQLRALSGKELLTTLFYNDSDKKENLCYDLEMNAKIKSNFGSISGGSAFKFGLFYHRQKLCWMTGSANKPKQLTEEEAITLGTEIRDQLVAGAEEIAKFGSLNTTADYETLFEKVRQHIRLDNIWILKYYKMIFPELFHSAYSEDQQRHMLYALQIQPHENQFVRMGQIALFSKDCSISNEVLKKVFEDTIGWYKPIYRIGTGDAGDSEFSAWHEGAYCALGFRELGNFDQYLDEKGNADKEKIANALFEQNDSYNKSTASRKANEIVDFIDADNDETIVVAMNGQMLLGIGFLRSNCYYDNTTDEYPNKRQTEWRFVSENGIRLPVFEGRLTSFTLLNDEQNMMLLYKLLYYQDQSDNEDSEWGPPLSVYDPGISKEQWLSLLRDKSIFTDKCLLAMACMYDNGGYGSCTGLAEKYNQSMTLWRTSCGVHLAGRVAEKMHCPLQKRKNGQNLYYQVVFLIRDTKEDEIGSYVYKIRPELMEALAEFGIQKYLPQTADQQENEMTNDHEAAFTQWLASGMSGKEYADDVIQKQYIQPLKRIQLPGGVSIFSAPDELLLQYYRENLLSKDGQPHTYEACAMQKYLAFLDQGLETVKPIQFATGYYSDFSRNRIIFGAPGTGKSYTLNSEKDILLADGGAYERVTFHPDYTYAHFVGTYKPVPCQDQNGNDAITYKYVPGPFMRTYVKALRNSREETPLPFLLIIEEINRANVAAVFGDIFQLLDRDDDETSEYAIQATEDMKRYLADELGGQHDDYAEIRLPDNFFIWATMNSADQGVFPMDTAFKRRWNFTYLNINAGEASIAGKKVVLGNGGYQRDVEWNELRKAINDRLSSFRVNEDKLLGPFFLSKKVIPAAGEIDPARFMDAFKNKVLMYLYDDAAKQKRASLFASDVDTTKYSAVCDAFDERGVCAFCTEISCRFQPTDGDEA